MPPPKTPKIETQEQLDRFQFAQKVRQAEREAKETAYLRRATKQMRQEVSALLQKSDLKAKDIPPSLVLRRLLYVGFSRADAPALSALKNLNDLIRMKAKVDGEGEQATDGAVTALLDE